MVGFEKEDTLTPNQKIIAGCISGGMTRFITQPLDIIKLRTQLQKKKVVKKGRFFRTTRAILKEEGITGFWAGHNLGQMHSVLAHRPTNFPLPKTSSQFYAYELSTRYVMKNTNPEYRTFFIFLCGIFAGCCSATLVIPLEVIRVRQMLVKAQYGGLLQGAKQVYMGGGLLAFYEGLGASLLQMGPSSGIAFGVFRLTQPVILELITPGCTGEHCERHSTANLHKPQYIFLASSLAGSMAGFVSKTCTYPFDLAKRRLQISSHKEDPSVTPKTSRNLVRCHNLTDCLRITLKKEGFFGLFRGWKVTVYKAQLSAIVSFSSYEVMCHMLREQFQAHD